MVKPEANKKPQTLTDHQKRDLINTLRAIGVRPKLTDLLEKQQILFAETAELITLAARANPELAAIPDATWERIIQNLNHPEQAPHMKDSHGRGG
jgi:hypothetical protein